MDDDSESGVKDEVDDPVQLKKNKKLKKKKERKRKHSPSSCGSDDEPAMKKAFKTRPKHKKKCKKRHKHDKEKKHKLKDKSEGKKEEEDKCTVGPEVPKDLPVLPKAQSMAPMSKDEWEKRQSKIRRVYDEETGRTRLVRGEGEIIEEIVSRERHQEINRRATQGDGDFFQSKLKKLN